MLTKDQFDWLVLGISVTTLILSVLLLTGSPPMFIRYLTYIGWGILFVVSISLAIEQFHKLDRNV